MSESRTVQRLALLGVPLLLAWGALRATSDAFSQVDMVRRYQAVPATVEHSWLDAHTGRGGTVYGVRVRLRYRFGDQERRPAKSRVHPVHLWGGRFWAEDLLTRFPKGEEVTAWVDPKNPSDAFLIRDIEFDPYLIALVAAMLAVGSFVLIVGGTRRTTSWAISWAACVGVLLFYMLHYLNFVEGGLPAAFWITLVTCGALLAVYGYVVVAQLIDETPQPAPAS